MTVEIHAPDGSIVEFPDGTDDATMASAMQKAYGGPSQGSVMNTLKDVALSAGSGLARGAAETAMLPVTAARGVGWLMNKASDLGRAVSGRTETPQEEAYRHSSDLQPLYDAQDQFRTAADGTLHKPTTVAGGYANTIGEFAPALIGGPGGLLRRALTGVVAPAVTSETAGIAARNVLGPDAEPYARLAGAIMGNGATGLAQRYVNAPEQNMARSLQAIPEQAFNDAIPLQGASQRTGVALTGPEMIHEAAGQGTSLPGIVRAVEASPGGAPVTAPFFAQRPAQVETAVNNTLDTIAPQSAQPSTLGPRAADAAQGAIDDVRQNINATTRPFYQQAEQHVVNSADFDPIARDPAFQASLTRLRNDPVLGPQYAGLPDNSGAVVDAVTKDMGARGTVLSNAANPGFQPQAAAAYNSGAAEARDILRDPARGGVQAYDDALRMQEQARRQNLNPLEQGPLGRVAGATTTQQAGEAILPKAPLTGSQDELVTALQRLQGQDAALPAGVIRQHLGDRFDTVARDVATGPNQSVGGRFFNDVAGTPQQRTNLDAAVNTTAPQAGNSLADLLSTLSATRGRLPAGSPTAANTALHGSMDTPTLPGAILSGVKTGGASLPGDAVKAERAYRALQNTRSIASMMVAPDSLQQLTALRARALDNPMTQALLRSAVQAPYAVQGGR